MRVLVLVLWLVLFIVLFGFAVNNTAETELRFYGLVWHAPLVEWLLFFFVAGFALGLVAMLPAWFRQRLKLRRLRRTVRDLQPVTGAPQKAARGPDTLQSVAQGARETL